MAERRERGQNNLNRDHEVLLLTDESPTQQQTQKDLPAIELFQGSFQEIRLFYEHLSKKHDVELQIVTSKWGIIRGTERIQNYGPRKRNFTAEFKNWIKKGNSAEYLIILLPSLLLRYLVKASQGASLSTKFGKIIFVGPPSYAKSVCDSFGASSENFYSFRRVGVTRITKEYRSEIMKIIESTSK